MSSERDESAELLGELSVKSDGEKEASSPEKKSQEPSEHAKPKKRGRRGKKRKQRKSSSGAASENPEDPEGRAESPPWDSDEDLDCEISSYSDVIIRPINVPKAPENSTQFIIDDHNECRLYMSFETPNPYLSSDQQSGNKEGMIIEPIGEDAAYRDIDFEYDPPQDFDNSAYYDREFELSYKSNRFEELLRLSRTELISGLRDLEARLKELSDDLVKVNPSPILEQLQAQLLELQEKHFELKECHSSLTALVAQNEVGSTTNTHMADSQTNPPPPDISDETPPDSASVSKHDVAAEDQDTEHIQGSSKSKLSESDCDHTAIKNEIVSNMTDNVLPVNPELEASSSVPESVSNVRVMLAVTTESVSSMQCSPSRVKSEGIEVQNADSRMFMEQSKDSHLHSMTDLNINASFEQSSGSNRGCLSNPESKDMPLSAMQEHCELSGVVQV